jgi:hypothetical protein
MRLRRDGLLRGRGEPRRDDGRPGAPGRWLCGVLAGWYEYCSSKYRSFNANTGTYTGYDGLTHYCQ